MKEFTRAIIAAIFFMFLSGAVQAQKEVDPPAIPPMLEDRPPLVQPQPRESQSPGKVQEQQSKRAAKTKTGKKKSSGSVSGKKKGKKSSTVTGKKKSGNEARKKGVTAEPKQRKGPNNT
jgi:hypothetical protein